MKNRIELTIEHKHHTSVVLTNESGDTFTYDPTVWEGLEDFLSGAKILDIPVVSTAERTFTAGKILELLEDCEHMGDARNLFIRAEIE